MFYEIYKIKQILEDSEIDFKMKVPSNYEDIIYMPLNYILDDYIEMLNMLSEIEEIIDKIIQKEDENMNIGELMADQDQEGENNEL